MVPEEDVLDRVEAELRYARSKFPGWPTDVIHATAIVAEEAGEAVKAALRFTYEDGSWHKLREELVQTAAMAIRALQNLDAAEARRSETVVDREREAAGGGHG